MMKGLILVLMINLILGKNPTFYAIKKSRVHVHVS